MTQQRYWTLGAILALAIAIAGVSISFATRIHANPAGFLTCQTAAATTSLAYMTPGIGTTTLQLPVPTGALNCGGNLLANDSAYLEFQVTATTSPVALPTLVMRVEHSRDGVDWYAETLALNATATSTQLSGDAATYKWIIASSTDQGGSGTASRYHRSVSIPTPTQYTRVIFSDPTGGGNYGLYAELEARRQNP